jgi:hypothetical protein
MKRKKTTKSKTVISTSDIGWKNQIDGHIKTQRRMVEDLRQLVTYWESRAGREAMLIEGHHGNPGFQEAHEPVMTELLGTAALAKRLVDRWENDILQSERYFAYYAGGWMTVGDPPVRFVLDEKGELVRKPQ